MSKKDIPDRTKCSYADKYQAKRKPRCGCTSCDAKWKAALAELERRG